MIELRWLAEPEIREERGDHRVITYRAEKKRLQYRKLEGWVNGVESRMGWSEWKDVPEVREGE